MTRKAFLIGVPSALLVGVGTVFGQNYGAKEEKAFVDAFNNWAMTANRNGLTIDVHEIRAWHETTHAWARLKSIVEQSYK